MTPPGEFLPDSERASRTGLEESIFCAQKTASQIQKIVSRLSESGQRALFTRLEPEKFAQLSEHTRSSLDYHEPSHTAVLGKVRRQEIAGLVAIVSAGTSDARVVAEAQQTLIYYGYEPVVYQDAGVAGLWRLLAAVDHLSDVPVIIAIAGMEASMPTVLAGLVKSVIIAVPTSIGYGVAAGGQVALSSLLTSCAAGMTVVNIDNGFGAACAAVKILNISRGRASARPEEEAARVN